MQLEHLRGCISQAHEILIVTHYSVLSLIMAFGCFAIRLCRSSVRSPVKPLHLLDWSSSYIRFQEEVDIEMFSADILEAADGSSVANDLFNQKEHSDYFCAGTRLMLMVSTVCRQVARELACVEVVQTTTHRLPLASRRLRNNKGS